MSSPTIVELAIDAIQKGKSSALFLDEMSYLYPEDLIELVMQIAFEAWNSAELQIKSNWLQS